MPPAVSEEELEKINQNRAAIKPEETHLRSVAEVKGYRIRAEDGDIGHIDDFIVEDNSWTIRYIVIDTRNWLPGKKVLASPAWIKSISWADNKIYMDVTTEEIKNGPEYDPSQPVNREYETRFYDFYGRPKYWG